jgi:hypothetical protein
MKAVHSQQVLIRIFVGSYFPSCLVSEYAVL